MQIRFVFRRSFAILRLFRINYGHNGHGYTKRFSVALAPYLYFKLRSDSLGWKVTVFGIRLHYQTTSSKNGVSGFYWK